MLALVVYHPFLNARYLCYWLFDYLHCIYIDARQIGPTYILGRKILDSQVTVDLLFGGLVCITGLIGTPLGGYIIDRYISDTESSENSVTKVAKVIIN